MPGSNTGVPGPRGPMGEKGVAGSVGPRGPKGNRGSQSGGGVQYIRWGRTTCPSHTQLVYKGTVTTLTIKGETI